MRDVSAKAWADLGERTVWTLLQAGFGMEVVNLLDLPAWVAVPVAGALAAVKVAMAQQFGQGSGATLPRDLES